MQSAVMKKEGRGRGWRRKGEGDVLKVAHGREGCHRHCNQSRLEELHPRLLRLHTAGCRDKFNRDSLGKKYENGTSALCRYKNEMELRTTNIIAEQYTII